MNKGRIIVVEGASDGVGKQTQCEMLKSKLESQGVRVIKHGFPSYGTYQGKGVEEYLSGSYGDIKNLSPYFINGLYAMDRAITWNINLKKEYDAGGTVILDRYTTSSLIYQSVFIEDEEEKKKFIDYVCDFEYKKLGIGEPDKIIFLCPSFDVATKLRLKRKGKEGISNDLHERDLEFLKKVYDNAVFVAKYLGWDIVECDDGNEMKSREEIHSQIIKSLGV